MQFRLLARLFMHKTSLSFSQNRLSNIICFLFFMAFPFRDVRFISFLSLQDFLLVIGILILLIDPNFKYMVYKFSLGTLLICVLMALTTFYHSENYAENLINISKVAFAYGVMSIYLLSYARNSNDLHKYALYGISCGLFLALLLNLESDQIFAPSLRLQGLSGHANYFAFSGLICVTLSLFYATISIFDNFFRLFFFLIGFYSIVLSISTTAILCFSFIIVLYASKSKGLASQFFRSLLGILISIFLYFNLNFFKSSRNRLSEAFTERYSYSIGGLGNNSLQDRIYTNAASIEKIKKNPFLGYGLDVDGRLTSTGIETHNYLLLSWQTGGIFFLVFQLILISLLIRHLVRAPILRVNVALSLCLFSFLFSQPWIYERTTTSIFFLVLGNLKNEQSFKSNSD